MADTTTLISTIRVEGFHQWPDAPSEHAYLSAMHRHIFHIRIETRVTDANREREFIAEGRGLRGLLATTYGCARDDWEAGRLRHALNFGARSCEMIAGEVLSMLPHLSACEVWEDGENGARVER